MACVNNSFKMAGTLCCCETLSRDFSGRAPKMQMEVHIYRSVNVKSQAGNI